VRTNAREATHIREWSSTMLRTSRCAVGERHMGDVGLPALVGELGGEAVPGALGSLVGLGGDKAPGLEDPPDG
jgi:hypothetical protein